MKKEWFTATPGGLLMAAFLIYCLPPNLMFAYALAIGAHEGGHLIALRLLGYPVESLGLETGGLVIRHAPFHSWGDQLFCVGMGPLAGLLFAVFCFRVDCLVYSSGFSLLLSFYNLLPGIRSDGGRMLEALLFRLGVSQGFCDKILIVCSAVTGLMLLAVGLRLWRRGLVFGLLPAVVFLFIHAFFQEGIVKKSSLR